MYFIGTFFQLIVHFQITLQFKSNDALRIRM